MNKWIRIGIDIDIQRTCALQLMEPNIPREHCAAHAIILNNAMGDIKSTEDVRSNNRSKIKKKGDPYIIYHSMM